MIKFLMLVIEAITYGVTAVSLDAVYVCIKGLVIVPTFFMYRLHSLEYKVCNARWRLVDHMHARQRYYTGGSAVTDKEMNQ